MNSKSIKEVPATQAQNNFGELMRNAQRQPVKVTKRGSSTVVVMSEEAWQRVHGYRLAYLAKEAAKQAKTAGLTERKLKTLLADD